MYTSQLGRLSHPIAIRYPRGRGVTLDWQKDFTEIEIGTAIQLKKGSKIAILSVGTISKNCTEAIDLLLKKDLVSHYDMRFVKPLDKKLLHDIFKTHQTIFTVEDGCISGGFGSAILEFASKYNYKNTFKLLGIPDQFIEHGTTEELLQQCHLDSLSISKLISEYL
jgi:1-deoxy-D-xylulose-5-phosphate synthase